MARDGGGHRPSLTVNRHEVEDPGTRGIERTAFRSGLLERVRSGDSSEQDAAISELMEIAKRSRDGGDWNVVGLALLEAGRLEQAAGVLKKLADIFPNDSDIRLNLAIAEMSRQDCADGSCKLPRRVDCLLRLVAGDDPALRGPALSQLRRMIEQDPQDSEHRLRYGFALMVIEDRDGAAREATILDSVDDRSYSFHLNLGQIFYYCGDMVKGRAHLDLAIQYAEYEQDRMTARKLIADREEEAARPL